MEMQSVLALTNANLCSDFFELKGFSAGAESFVTGEKM